MGGNSYLTILCPVCAWTSECSKREWVYKAPRRIDMQALYLRTHSWINNGMVRGGRGCAPARVATSCSLGEAHRNRSISEGRAISVNPHKPRLPVANLSAPRGVTQLCHRLHARRTGRGIYSGSTGDVYIVYCISLSKHTAYGGAEKYALSLALLSRACLRTAFRLVRVRLFSTTRV